MRYSVSVSNIKRDLDTARKRYIKDLDRAARIATDRASREAQKAVRQRMSSVKLGRLGGAVAQTSALKKRQTDKNPYGVIYARGGDESRAGGALEAYSRGSTIRANQGLWLAYPTKAVPKRIGRKRTTADLYRKSGLMGSIGKLEFRPVRPGLALLVIKKVTVSPKTGRAKAAGPRKTRTRIPMKEVVAFVLIRVTRRAKRFDKDVIVGREHRQVPRYMAEALAEIRARP